MKPRKSLLKRIGLIFALLVCVGPPAAHFIWGKWAQHRLNQTLNRLHAAGEPILPGELSLGSMPDAQNASLMYKTAGASIQTGTVAWKAWDDATSGYQIPLTDAERQTVHAIIVENSAALAGVVNARGKSAGGWNDPFAHPSVLTLYDLNGARGLCNLLHLAAMEADANGDDAAAVGWLGDVASIADASQKRPTLVAHLVAVGCTAAAGQWTCELAPQLHAGKNGLRREAMLQLLAELQDERAMNDGCKIGWRTERMLGLTSFQDMANGTMQGSTRVQAYVLGPRILNDAAPYADHLQGIMFAAAAPDWITAQRQMPTQLPAMIQKHPMFHLLTSILIPSFDRALKADYLARATRRLGTVSIAARLYAADHNDHLPSNLADMVPAYLPAMPIDPMSGSAFKFNADPPRVYSVGEDGVDDGGIPVDREGDSYRRKHGDIVAYLVTQPRKATSQPSSQPTGIGPPPLVKP